MAPDPAPPHGPGVVHPRSHTQTHTRTRPAADLPARFLRGLLLALLTTVLALPTPRLLANGPVLTEFLAANGAGLLDTDGDASDWIELFNPSAEPIPLAGWFLTDTPRNLALWRFPAVTLPPQGFLVVFASGKNRTDPARELHTGFQLGRDGEFLALVQPDGRTVESLYPQPYPRHATDISYGLPMTREATALVPEGARARLHAPTDDRLARTWTTPAFDDTAWTTVDLGIGYFQPGGNATDAVEPLPDPVDVTNPDDFIVPTSSNSPGNEGVLNAIDNNTATKYLNFDRLNAGLTVTPSAGPSVVQGLRLTTANDAPERDPTSFLLSGSHDGQAFTEIARGTFSPPTTRFTPLSLSFPNTNAWTHYRLLFPTVRNPGAAVAVQIAEIELLGHAGPPPADFTTLYRTDLRDTLHTRAHGAYLRIPFTVDDPATPATFTLHLRFEDGVIAYLNGTEVARSNAPTSANAFSNATTQRLRRDAASTPVAFDLSPHAHLLRPGTNLLALHGLNSAPDSADFLLDATLRRTRISLGSAGHLPTPTPGDINPPSAGGLVDPVISSPPRGFHSQPVDVTLSCPTPGVTLRYTTDGSVPSPTHGAVYSGPVRLTRTTALRAAAFRDGWHPSPVITHTHLFPDDILLQDRAGALAAGFPATWNNEAADYGLDRRVVGPAGTDAYNGRYLADLRSDLRTLPSISLVLPIDAMFGPLGIYANPGGRGEAWERAASVEWIPGNAPGDTPGFQENAGIRIQGGAFRSFSLTRKKSFRLVFRAAYGVTRLEQPIFGPNATDRFNTLVLRANSNDAWPYGGGRAVYVRDTFAMDTARALGIPASHSRFAHLFINGQYWGLYNPVERPDAGFAESYLGGDKDDWDSINQDSAPDGSYDAWNRLLAQSAQDLSGTDAYQRIQGNHPDGSRNPAFEKLIDVDNYIDYLILNFYVGNTDWPHRNWWAGRPRISPPDLGFQFRPWDTETALDFSGLDADVTGVTEAVARPYAALRRNADFRLRFADHVFRHFFHGGPLYVNPANPRWDPARPENNQPAARFAAAVAAVRPGIVGETARWGDQMGNPLMTRDQNWQPAINSLLANYFPARSARVLAQFRRAGLYPPHDPPAFSQRGGPVPRGFPLTLSSPSGVIHYTLDGTDPRGPGGTVSGLTYSGPIVLRADARVTARTLNNGVWSALHEAAFTTTAPTFDNLGLQALPEPPNRVRLRFSGRQGQGYTVYQRSSLSTGEWTVFHSGIPRPADGPVELLLDLEPRGTPRFFQVSIP